METSSLYKRQQFPGDTPKGLYGEPGGIPIQQATPPKPATPPNVPGSTAAEADPATTIASKAQVPNKQQQQSAAALITKAQGGTKMVDAAGKPVVPVKAIVPGGASKLTVPRQPAKPGQQPPKPGQQPPKPVQARPGAAVQPPKPGQQPPKPGQQPPQPVIKNFGKPLGAPLPNAPALTQQQAAAKRV
jgi:hypothetical protein